MGYMKSISKKYPYGMQIHLKTDYPGDEVKTVYALYFTADYCMVELNNGSRINSKRIEELIIKEKKVGYFMKILSRKRVLKKQYGKKKVRKVYI